LLAGANTKSSDNTATSYWRLNAFDQFCQLVGCFVWESKI